MKLTTKDLNEVKRIWFAETGEEIDDAKALREAQRILIIVQMGLPRETEKEPDSSRGP